LRRSSPDQEAPRDHLSCHTRRATLDVPRELARYLGRLLHAERRRRGTRRTTRALACFTRAVLGLRWFRQGVDVTALARDHAISRATGYRYLDEVITVLADQAPDLNDALQGAKNDGLTHLILDGKVFSTDRCGEQTTSVKGQQIDAWYSGKAHQHGGNIQALTTPTGCPLWVSDVEPGSVHDLTAARETRAGRLVLGGLPTRSAHAGRRRLHRSRHRRAHAGHTALRWPGARCHLTHDSSPRAKPPHRGSHRHQRPPTPHRHRPLPRLRRHLRIPLGLPHPHHRTPHHHRLTAGPAWSDPSAPPTRTCRRQRPTTSRRPPLDQHRRPRRPRRRPPTPVPLLPRHRPRRRSRSARRRTLHPLRHGLPPHHEAPPDRHPPSRLGQDVVAGDCPGNGVSARHAGLGPGGMGTVSDDI